MFKPHVLPKELACMKDWTGSQMNCQSDLSTQKQSFYIVNCLMTPTYCISEIRVNDIYRLSSECAVYFAPSSSGTCTCK